MKIVVEVQWDNRMVVFSKAFQIPGLGSLPDTAARFGTAYVPDGFGVPINVSVHPMEWISHAGLVEIEMVLPPDRTWGQVAEAFHNAGGWKLSRCIPQPTEMFRGSKTLTRKGTNA